MTDSSTAVRALRRVREYNEKVEYIHLNPVRAGRMARPQDRPWSSSHDYTGSTGQRPRHRAPYPWTACGSLPTNKHESEVGGELPQSKGKQRLTLRFKTGIQPTRDSRRPRQPRTRKGRRDR